MTSDGIRYSNIDPDQEISAAPCADRRHRAAEPEPVPGRNVALGDGDEAGQPRFRRQQVVAIGIERVLRHADSRSTAAGGRGRTGSRTPSSSAIAARLVRQRLETRRQRGAAGSGCPRDRGWWLSMRRRGRLRPEHAGPRRSSSPRLDRERAGDVGQGLGPHRQSRRDARAHVFAVAGGLPQLGGQTPSSASSSWRHVTVWVRAAVAQRGAASLRASARARRRRLRGGRASADRTAGPFPSRRSASAIRCPARLPLSTDET